MKTFYSNFKKLTPVVVMAIILSMLASCSSSNQMASSFSKRKYMPGHFSDPIAKVKTGVENAIASAANDTKKAVNEIRTAEKTEEAKIAEPSVIAQAKPVSLKAENNKLLAKVSQNHVAAKAVVLAVDDNNKNNVGEASDSYASPSSLESVQHDGGDHHHHYLGDAILCFLLAILCWIIALGSAVGGSGAGFGLFAILSYLLFIAALVFFIVWLIHLAD
jgi:hypothetical protein